MKRYFKTIVLLAGLGLASPLLAGQGQAIPANAEAVSDLQERVNELERRLEDIRAELDRVRQQLHECSTPTPRVNVSKKTKELKQRIEIAGAALDSVKEEMRSATAALEDSPQSLPQVRMVQSQRRRNLDIDLTSARGPFALGPNSFCLDFRSTRDGKAIDAGEVRVDFTGAIGKVQAVRALARLAQSGSGHYCGQVTLTTPGEWLVTANFYGPSGSGKAVFTQTVK
jgi:hypothetical protein